MSERVPQTLANHMKLDPWFHFVLLPGLLAMLIWTVVHWVREPESESAMFVATVLLMIVMALRVRPYALKVQDRVIRLEERLRLAGLGGNPLGERLCELTEAQLIALRFAADEEAPSLAQRTLKESMRPKEIKAAIRNWRGDYWRV